MWLASVVSLGIPSRVSRAVNSDGLARQKLSLQATRVCVVSKFETNDLERVCSYSLIIRVSEYRFRPFRPTPIGHNKSGEAELIGTSIDTATKSPLRSPRSTPI